MLTGGGIAWMVATLDAHDEAYRQRGESGMSFGGEIAAGQLWDRMLADDDSFVWLTERGMPDPVDGIRPAPASASPVERSASWTAFLDAATSDPEWSQWLDSQGSSLAVEWALAQPVAALSGWADHSGSVLAGATGHSEGGNAVRGVLATIQPFFRGAGWTSDVALLFAAAALLVLFARRARENGEVHRADGGAAVRRRRECNACKRRFTTYERVERQQLSVVKKGGGRVPFDREKIRKGLAIACGKRPVTDQTIEGIVSAVEQECHDAFETEVPSRAIGERVMEIFRVAKRIAPDIPTKSGVIVGMGEVNEETWGD